MFKIIGIDLIIVGNFSFNLDKTQKYINANTMSKFKKI